MKWKELIHENEIEEMKQISFQKTILFFKHSTRCSISAMALSRLERSWKEEEINAKNIVPCYIDLIQYRSISNQIEEDFNVEHQSPQVLLIKDGKCIYHASHGDINYSKILDKA